uniref:ATP-cone domain-containing protein n=1 Tax=candidate division WWE3 bacterium TaxID=2053526 RepID=A0A832E0J9_UNCKA
MARKTATIVKRQGHRENYDERKVYASVYAACLAAGEPETSAEKVSTAVAKRITRLMLGWKVAKSDQIFRQVIVELGKLSPKAVFLYENHRDLS